VNKIARQMCFSFAKGRTRSRVKYLEPDRRNQIRARLEEALLCEPPPSLHAVARSLKMSNSTQLRLIEPELSDRLSQLAQTWKEKKEAAIRAAFEAPFDAKRPLSLEEFCEFCNISYSVIRRKYPDIKEAYTSRFRMSRLESKKVRTNQRADAVAEALKKISTECEYPSVGRVKDMTPELKPAGWDEIQAYIRNCLMPQ
jgi:AraC-like DNA-binding protein